MTKTIENTKIFITVFSFLFVDLLSLIYSYYQQKWKVQILSKNLLVQKIKMQTTKLLRILNSIQDTCIPTYDDWFRRLKTNTDGIIHGS